MAYTAEGTDYGTHLRSRAQADERLSGALRRKGERDRQARIKKSGQRSLLQKGLSAAARGGLAYMTGGASEAMGFGGAVDEVMLGTDSEGRPVRNEYGELVRTGSAVYGGMKDKKAADIAGKRARNLQDYKHKVDLAEKMGVLDKEQGAKMLLSAEELREGQKGQTSKADKRGVWGWDNEYDPLELQPNVLKGKEEADLRAGVTRKDAEMIPSYYQDTKDRKETARGRQFDESSEMEKATMGETQTERYDREMRDRINKKFPEHQSELDKVEAMYERDRKKAFLANENLDRQEDPLITDSIKKRRAVDEMMDSEYNKEISRGGLFSGSKDDYLSFGTKADRESNEGEVYRQGPYKATEEGGHEYWSGSKPKKLSKEEAKKLSEKDSDKARTGTLDDMAIDERVKNLKKQDWWDRTFKRSGEDDQLLLEDRIKSERALKKKLATQPKSYGRADYEGSLYRPFESALKKRIRERREKEARTAKARGGILAG